MNTCTVNLFEDDCHKTLGKYGKYNIGKYNINYVLYLGIWYLASWLPILTNVSDDAFLRELLVTLSFQQIL